MKEYKRLKNYPLKNYLTAFLAICIVLLTSIIYRDSKSSPLISFPVEGAITEFRPGESPLYLYIFFSRHNCPVCLEAIQVLNELPPPFVVTGIVPVEEMKNETELRNTTGASFDLIELRDGYKRFTPHYMPTIYGVAGSGKILFVIPGVPGENKYLYDFLTNFYTKSTDLL